MERVQIMRKLLLNRPYLGHNFCIDRLKFHSLRHHSVVILMCQHYGPVKEIAQYGNKLAIVACLKIAPGKIVVFCFRGIGCEHIAQHVLLAGEILKIFVKPYGPVARCRNFVALQIQELVGRNIFRKLVAVAISHKHCRENYAVEHYVVLAYKVYYTCFRVFPVCLPRVRQNLLCVRYIAYRRIEPHI